MEYANNVKDQTKDLMNNAMNNAMDNIKQLENKYVDTKQYVADNIQNLKDNAMEMVKQPLEEVKTNIISKTTDLIPNTATVTEQIKSASAMVASPTIVYSSVALTALGMAAFENISAQVFVYRFFAILIWGYCINTICRYDMEMLAWIIVLIPYVLIVLQMLEVVQIPRILFNIIMSTDEQSFFGI